MRKAIKIGILVLLMITVFGINAFADGGKGGGNSALQLESSVPADKGKIGLEDRIKLKFSNNVVNMKVAENNKTCFKLVDNDGNEIPIQVVMGDDQVNKDVKNDIEIVPGESLKEGKTYQLIINGNLQAKNGNKIGKETTLTFNTGGNGVSPVVIGGVVAVLALISFVLFGKKVKKS